MVRGWRRRRRWRLPLLCFFCNCLLVFFVVVTFVFCLAWAAPVLLLCAPDPANADWVNAFYGGKDLEGSNIVLPNGSIDPWHALGVTDATGLPPSVTTVYMTVRVCACV